MPWHDAVLAHQQVEREILDEELRVVAQRLAVERVEDGVAGAVGSGAGALHRRALAELGHVAAERPLVDLALVGARERHAIVLELIDRGGRLARQILHGVHVAEPVRPLDGVVHVPLPVVRAHVLERGGNAALRRDGMRTRRKHLGHAGGVEPLLGHAQRRPEPRSPGAHDHHVELVVDDLIGGHALTPEYDLGDADDAEHRDKQREAGIGGQRHADWWRDRRYSLRSLRSCRSACARTH